VKRSLLWAKLYRGLSYVWIFTFGLAIGRGATVVLVVLSIVEAAIALFASSCLMARYEAELRIDESKIEVLP
jgi:4-hydroxybenzoate polyprenyltransferase